jgi:hypothetical protein
MAVIRQRTQIFNQPVGVVRADAGAASVGQAISQAAGTMANLAFRDAARAAEKKGVDVALAAEQEKLTTIDPTTGKPEAYKAPQGFGQIAAEAYQRVIDQRFEDSINTEMQLKAKELALKYQLAPESYDEAMSDYIGQMSNNSGGKYEAYIESTGAKYLALTKLNIQEKVVARARANASSQLSISISNNQDEAMSAAAAGDFESAIAIKNKNVGAASDGIASALPNFNTGDDQRVASGYDKAIALGGIDYLMKQTATPMERSQLILYLQSNGDRGIALDEAETKKVLEFIDPSERQAIVNYASGVSSDYDAAYADEQKAIQASVGEQARIDYLKFEESVDTYSDISAYVAYNTTEGSDLFGPHPPIAINSAFNTIKNHYNTLDQDFQKYYKSGVYGKNPEVATNRLRKERNNAKLKLIEPFLTELGLEDNIDSAKAALQNPNYSRELLTPRQRSIIDELHASDFLDNQEIKDKAQSILNSGKDSLKQKRDNRILELDLTKEVSNAITRGVTPDVYSNLEEKLRANAFALTATDIDGLLSSMRKSMANNEVTGFIAQGASSAQLNNLNLYVATDGKDRDQLSDATIAVGDAILKVTTPEDKEAVLSDINSLNVRVKEQEKQREDQLEEVNRSVRILSGNGDSNIAKDRQATDTILDRAKLPVENFSSWTDAQKSLYLPIVASAVSDRLVDGLKAITSGQLNTNAESFISLYNALPKGAFGGSISPDDRAFLNDVINLSRDTETPIAEIAVNLKKMQLSEAGRQNRSNQLVNNKGEKISLISVANEITKNDPTLAMEIKSTLDYYLLSGASLDVAKEKAQRILDEKYTSSEYIADPALPMGNVSRSRHSLENYFKGDDEARIAFLSAVNRQLPKNIEIDGEIVSFALGEIDELPVAPWEEDTRPEQKIKQIKLVPVPVGSDVFYQAYFIDKNNELRPLIYRSDSRGKPLRTEEEVLKAEGGQLWLPTFNKNDISDYYDAKAAELEAQLRKENEQRKQFIIDAEDQERLRKTPSAILTSPFGG